MQDSDGQILNTHSISAGLDYPGVGPELALWADRGRVEYCAVNDDEALRAFYKLTQLEGIIPALESAHAVAEALRRAPGMTRDDVVIVNLSGRGDKDVESVLAMESRQ